MADQMFQPMHRKKFNIAKEEAQQEPPEIGEDPMAGVKAVQATLAEDLELGRNNFVADEGGLEFSGNAPPQFRNAARLDQMAATAPTPVSKSPRPRPDSKQEREWSDSPQSGMGNNFEFQQIINNLQSRTQNYEMVQLPSGGRFYNGSDGPTSGILHVRPMTGEEEQILGNTRLARKGATLDAIFKNCIQERFQTEHMLSADRTYLLIYLRGISYTPEYDVEMKCPSCRSKYNETIDLDSIQVDECPEGCSSENLTGTLPITNYQFTYRFPRGSDEPAVAAYKERQARGFGGGNDVNDDTSAYRLSLLVEEFHGISDKTQIMMILKNLPIGDVNYIKQLTEDIPFGVKTEIPLLCPYCSHEFEIDLPLEASFFFPPLKKKPQKE